MTQNAEPFALRGPDNSAEWFCIVAGRQFGPWPGQRVAWAGYQTEMRRAERKANGANFLPGRAAEAEPENEGKG
jgi:hypothetical protein